MSGQVFFHLLSGGRGEFNLDLDVQSRHRMKQVVELLHDLLATRQSLHAVRLFQQAAGEAEFFYFSFLGSSTIFRRKFWEGKMGKLYKKKLIFIIFTLVHRWLETHWHWFSCRDPRYFAPAYDGFLLAGNFKVTSSLKIFALFLPRPISEPWLPRSTSADPPQPVRSWPWHSHIDCATKPSGLE